MVAGENRSFSLGGSESLSLSLLETGVAGGKDQSPGRDKRECPLTGIHTAMVTVVLLI